MEMEREKDAHVKENKKEKGRKEKKDNTQKRRLKIKKT